MKKGVLFCIILYSICLVGCGKKTDEATVNNQESEFQETQVINLDGVKENSVKINITKDDKYNNLKESRAVVFDEDDLNTDYLQIHENTDAPVMVNGNLGKKEKKKKANESVEKPKEEELKEVVTEVKEEQKPTEEPQQSTKTEKIDFTKYNIATNVNAVVNGVSYLHLYNGNKNLSLQTTSELATAFINASDYVTVKVSYTEMESDEISDMKVQELLDYECFDKDGKSLGKLSVDELNNLANSNKDNAKNEFVANIDNVPHLKGTVNVSSLVMGTDYYAEDDIEIVNDKKINYEITITYLDIYGNVATTKDYIAGAVADVGFADNTFTNTNNIFINIRKIKVEEFLSHLEDYEYIKISDLTSEDKSIMCSYIYNDSDYEVTIENTPSSDFEDVLEFRVPAKTVMLVDWQKLDKIHRK